MSVDEPENGYLDDIAETQETQGLTRSSDEWAQSTPASGQTSSAADADDESTPSARVPSQTSKSSWYRRTPKAKPSPTTYGPPSGPSGSPAGDGASPWRARGRTTFRFLRTMVVTALVLSGAAAVGNIAIHHLPRTTHHTYTYSNIQRILVAVDGDGAVSVEGTSSSNVVIKATDKATLLQPVQRQIISSGGLLIVSVYCPSTECSSSYDVQVPRTADVTVTLDNSANAAPIAVSDLDSPVDLYTGHGDVTMTNLTSNVHVVANGDVTGTGLGGQSIDVFAPIAKNVALAVTGSPQLVRLTTGQPGQVNLQLPAGAYNITCEPSNSCPLPGTSTSPGPITEDATSQRLVEITVNALTTANITAAG
jgi:hypothetical protein